MRKQSSWGDEEPYDQNRETRDKMKINESPCMCGEVGGKSSCSCKLRERLGIGS